MTPELKEAIETLKTYMEVRRNAFPQNAPDVIREAIDTVIRELEKSTTPKEIEDARRFIRECHADIGFMGSPEYYEKRKMLEEWDKKNEETK